MNETRKAMLIGTLIAGVVFAAMVWMLNIQSAVRQDASYSISLVCNNGLKTAVIAEHSRITIKESVYFIQWADGQIITFNKDAMSRCVTIADVDVVALPPAPPTAKPL